MLYKEGEKALAIARAKKAFPWKKVILISLAVLLAIGISAISFFLIVTADARLDLNKLTGSPSPLVILSSDKVEIDSSTTTKINGEIPEHTKNAFIAIEDKRFLSHHGIDIKRIGGAAIANLRSGSKSQGASTITQQLVKNTHLSSEKTFTRKLKEMKIALQTEKKLSKDEIIRAYLDNIYFGNGCIGIESAARFYFDKHTNDLTIAESALLAGLVKAPSNTEPKNHLEKALERRNLVLLQMKEQNLITEEEYNLAIEEKPKLVFNGENKELYKNYLKAAKLEAANILKLNQDELEESALIIETYADQKTQTALQDQSLSNNFRPKQNGKQIGSLGSVVLDPVSGGVKGFYSVGSYDFLTGKRQPASTIKPLLVYAPALEEAKITPESFVLDNPTNFNGYAPKNAGNAYLGWINAKTALSKSKNIPAVKILDMVGVEKAKEYVSRLGINFDDSDQSLALALGGMTKGTTILELAGAYSAFPSGQVKSPTFIKSIKTKDGKVLYQHNAEPKKVFSEATGYLITDMLKETAKTGTAKKLADLPFEVAAKTGTIGIENANTDCYNIAFTTNDIIVTLLTRGDEDISFSGHITGATLPTAFAKQVFNTIYKNNPPKDFAMPQTVASYNLDTRALENYELKLAEPQTQDRFIKPALFDITNHPTEYYKQEEIIPTPISPNANFISLVDKPEEVKESNKKSSGLDEVLDRIFSDF